MFSLIHNDDDEFFGGQILPQFFISFLESDIKQMPNYCPTSYNRLSFIAIATLQPLANTLNFSFMNM